MHDALSEDRVLALAPDASSAQAGRALAAPTAWASLGRDAGAAWGECRGSGREPYRTQVDLSDLAARCSCPSRKLPCKHALGLMLLAAAQPASLPDTAQPPWVAEWLAARARRAKQVAEPVREATPAADDAARRRAGAQARTAAAREAKVAAGMEELRRWLRDQARQGLATAQARPAQWTAMAARMVDAQAPGAARAIRELALLPASGEGWQARALERLGRLHLLAEGYLRLAELPPETQADVRASLGFTVSQEALLAGPGVRDTWHVLGHRITEEEQLRVRRTWLLGRATGRPALLMSFAGGGQPLEQGPAPGTTFEAALVFYPGAAPLRALVREPRCPARALESPVGTTATKATAAYATALARNPWLDRYPLCVGPATLARHAGRWQLEDDEGRRLPIAGSFEAAWRLLAVSGGAPATVAGEWDGEALAPLGAWAGGEREYVSLEC